MSLLLQNSTDLLYQGYAGIVYSVSQCTQQLSSHSDYCFVSMWKQIPANFKPERGALTKHKCRNLACKIIMYNHFAYRKKLIKK